MEGRRSEKEEDEKSIGQLCFDQSEVTRIPSLVRWFVKSIHIFLLSVSESNKRPDYIFISPLSPFIFLENNETDRHLVENGGKEKEGCIPEQA